MGNHIHLLLAEGKEDISVTMKRIAVSYAWYYNMKYKTTGHLFQDRFISENVETDEYLLTVIRYIHQNPVKAGIAKSTSDWKLSSCKQYYGIKSYPVGLLDNEFVLGMFSDDMLTAISRFKEFNQEENEDKALDDELSERITDDEAKVEGLKLVTLEEMAYKEFTKG